MATLPDPPDIETPEGTDAAALVSFSIRWGGQYIFVDASFVPVGVEVPNPEDVAVVTIKDQFGHCSSNNITVTAPGFLIDDQPFVTMDVDYAALRLAWNGENWSVV